MHAEVRERTLPDMAVTATHTHVGTCRAEVNLRTRGVTFNNGVDRSRSDSDGWGVGPLEPDGMTLPPMGSQPRDLGANHSTSRSNVTGGRAPGTISPSGNEWMGMKMEGAREGRATVGWRGWERSRGGHRGGHNGTERVKVY